jgi:predicted acyl esterase
MTDDRRFEARIPDVVAFETPILTEDMTLSGETLAKLQVAATGTDADWIIKWQMSFPQRLKILKKLKTTLRWVIII